MLRLVVVSALALTAAACGNDELRVVNRTSHALTVDIAAPPLELTGGCTQPFQDRFCAEEYAPTGILELSAGSDRLVTVFEPTNEEQCTNILWMRLLKLDEVGPIADPGTLIQFPATLEIELGAGPIHTAAFPQDTVRIDEVGTLDENQRPPPKTCAELGRAPR